MDNAHGRHTGTMDQSKHTKSLRHVRAFDATQEGAINIVRVCVSFIL